jgi:hypothetical protein
VSSLAGTVLGERQEERGAEFERAGILGWHVSGTVEEFRKLILRMCQAPQLLRGCSAKVPAHKLKRKLFEVKELYVILKLSFLSTYQDEKNPNNQG